MSKKDILKTLDISTFVSAVIATVLVLIFQFTGSVSVMKASIVMYAVAFLIFSVILGFKVYENFSKKAADENADSITKKQKILSIVYFSLSVIAFVFTCVLLVLY